MSALKDFVKKSAASYLQSVVFVDDHIYSMNGGQPLEVSSDASSRAEIDAMLGPTKNEAPRCVALEEGEANALAPTSEEPISDANEQVDHIPSAQYHPRELMESFAQHGIVCALYEPREGFETNENSHLFRLCERADVVILDWDLDNDDGDHVSDLLAQLIKKSQSELPHHVRLCALYTSKPSLHRVMDQLLENLEADGCEVEAESGILRLNAGATRISIFGKPASVGRPPQELQYEVLEKDLADKIISEFASLHDGLLPAFALHGLAAVRKNTKRLLEKFQGDLDGAFFLHRALGLSEGEAFEQLPELLADEIRAILEDMWPGTISLDPIAADAINALPITDPSPTWKNKSDGAIFDAKPAFKTMLAKGRVGLNNYAGCVQVADLDKRSFRGIKASLLKDFQSMLGISGGSSAESLARLFCNRTQYGSNERMLTFGTVVKHREKDADPWAFSVCLMPICDSQRLNVTKEYKFPFWTLRPDAKCGLEMRRHGISVEVEGASHALAAGGKIRDMLWIASFKPGPTKVVTTTLTNGHFMFETHGQQVEWVADLKPLHAQRIAAHLGAEASRVGLMESEWLRLFCDR
jgi:hypothetical protein